MKVDKPAHAGSREYHNQQRRLAEQVKCILPKTQQKLYLPQFQEIGSLADDSFVGLACGWCNCWADCGHDIFCIAPPLSESVIKRYKAAIRDCRSVQWTIKGEIAGKEFAY